jgi:hypothetical protein
MRRGRLGLACLCVFGPAALLGSGAPATGAAEACPNEAFRVGPSADLPDCRAYELVSPPEKGGQQVFDREEANGGVSGGLLNPVAARNGASVAYTTLSSPLPGSTSGGFISAYLARRTASGWSSEQISPPIGETVPAVGNFRVTTVPGLDEEFTKSIVVGWFDDPLTPDASVDTANLYLRDNANGSFRLLSVGAPAGLEGVQWGSAPTASSGFGSSADASHVVFTSPPELTPDSAAASSPYLYDWSAARGALSLVGRAPLTDEVLTTLVHLEPVRQRPVSADGSRIFFGGGGSGCGVCIRIDAATTQVVSAPGSTFWFASSDGSLAYITTSGDELKRYDVNADELGPSLGGEVQGVLGTSADGSRVYFVSKEDLIPGEKNSEGDEAEATKNNLYLWTDDGTAEGAITFIATGNTSSVFIDNWEEHHPDTVPSSRVTPDGMHLAFTANNSLTGYPNGGNSEAYLYSTATGRLVCASCNPIAAPTSGASIDGFFVDTMPRLPQNLSDDGSLLFFNTKEALVPRDSNNLVDAYEYDAVSGEVALISTGTANENTPFADAGASGNDAFLRTHQQLVGIDQEEAADIYDARVGGGLASQYLSSSPPCTGDGCRGATSPAPSQANAASAAFAGKGNLSSKQHCIKLGRESKKLSKRAKVLRKHARQVKRNGKSGLAKKRNGKATRLAKHAGNKSKSAKKCRKRNRGASKRSGAQRRSEPRPRPWTRRTYR